MGNVNFLTCFIFACRWTHVGLMKRMCINDLSAEWVGCGTKYLRPNLGVYSATQTKENHKKTCVLA